MTLFQRGPLQSPPPLRGRIWVAARRPVGRLAPACLLFCVLIFAATLSPGPALAQQPDPQSPRFKGMVALRDLLESNGDAALEAFITDRVAPSLRERYGDEHLHELLGDLRADFDKARFGGARPVGPFSARLEFSGGKSIVFELEPDAPQRYLRIGSIGGGDKAGHADEHGPRAGGDALAGLDDLEEYLAAEAAADRFSGVVLVARDGRPVFHEAYGLASRRYQVPNRLDTKFNIGSLNKLFTAVAIYQLVQRGTIQLGDPIGQYLPELPPEVGNEVTVTHLLEHRSGWAAYWDNEQFNARWRDLRSLDDYMAFIKEIPLDFEPGTRMQYSNTGYEVLGAIIERATDDSYDDYVAKNVFEPAGMKDTAAYERDAPVPNLAVGYTGPDHGRENTFMLAVRGTAAGGGYSTAADLLKFANALGDDSLIPPEYGSRYRGGGFAGGAPGVNATLELDVAGGHTIIVLSNFDPPVAGQVGRKITQMLARTAAARGEAPRGAGPPYRIGIGLERSEQGVVVDFLVPGAPGEKAGLRAGDVILSINGEPLGPDPIVQFDVALSSPNAISLIVQRGGARLGVVITPEPAGR